MMNMIKVLENLEKFTRIFRVISRARNAAAFAAIFYAVFGTLTLLIKK